MPKMILKLCAFIFLLMPFCACSNQSAVSAKYIDGITLTLSNKPFDEKSHKIQKCGDNYICTIDDLIYYGNGGAMPKQEVSSLVFSQNGKLIHLDTSAMYQTGITSDNINERIKVQSWGKGAYRIIAYLGEPKASYIAQWLTWEDGSIRNHFSDYESLVSLVFEVKKDFDITD